MLQKKTLLAYCIVIFFIVILLSSPAMSSIIKINNQSGKFGENITFTVTLTSSSSVLDALGFNIIFDKRMLKYNGFSKGPVAQRFNFFDISTPSDTTLKLGGFVVNPVTINQDEVLVYLHFTCVGKNEGKSDFAITNKVDDLRAWQGQPGSFTCIVEKNPQTIVENTEPSTQDQKVAEQKAETIEKGAQSFSQNQTVSETVQGEYRTSITRFSNDGEELDKKQKSPHELNQEGYDRQLQKDNNIGSRNEEGEENNKKNSGLTIIPKEYVAESPQPIKEQVFDTSGLRGHLYNQQREIPLVTETFPRDGDILATKDFRTIKFFFNQSMDNATVEKAFTIHPKAEGRFEWKNSLTELAFIPYTSLSPGISYLICITDKAKDVFGRPLDGNRDGTPEGNFCFTFKTEEKGEETTSAGQEAVAISPRVSRCFISTIHYNFGGSREILFNLSNTLYSLNHLAESGYSRSYTMVMLSNILNFFILKN